MDKCKECQANCCKVNLSVFIDEFIKLKEVNPDLKISNDYELVKNILPCPSLSENRCRYHGFRPLNCRKFPLYGQKTGEYIQYGFHIGCPYFKDAESLNLGSMQEYLNYAGINKNEWIDMLSAGLEFDARIAIVNYLLPLKLRNKMYLQQKKNEQKAHKGEVVFFFQIPAHEYTKQLELTIKNILEKGPFVNSIPEKYHNNLEKIRKSYLK